MRVIEVKGSLRVRLAAVFLVVIGLVGMHHLVTVGCASVLSGHSDGHAMADLAPPVVDADVLASSDHEMDAATGAGICLAVLVFSILILTRRSSWIRRDSLAMARVHQRCMSLRRTDPPDLLVLSISRT